MCSCEVDEFDDVSRSGHSTLLFVLFAVPALPRTSPHFPGLCSPHFPALPHTSPHFLGFLWIGRLGRDQDVVFLWFPLDSLGSVAVAAGFHRFFTQGVRFHGFVDEIRPSDVILTVPSG